MAAVSPLLGLLDSPSTIMDVVGKLQADFNFLIIYSQDIQMPT